MQDFALCLVSVPCFCSGVGVLYESDCSVCANIQCTFLHRTFVEIYFHTLSFNLGFVVLSVLMGIVAVIGDILQAAEESAVVLLAQPLSRRLLLLLESHAALLSGRLSSTEHTVNLLQSLGENQR